MSVFYLLDTNIVLSLVRGGPLGTYLDNTFSLRATRIRPAVSIVTHGEIRVLARRNRWGPAKTAVLQDALSSLVTVDIHSDDVLEAYVEMDLASSLHPGGARAMGKNDLWIAACTKAAGATLLTTDKDFEHLRPETLRATFVDPAPFTGSGPA